MTDGAKESTHCDLQLLMLLMRHQFTGQTVRVICLVAALLDASRTDGMKPVTLCFLP